jgi:uncharacterized membrane protein YedE/YeeE
MKYVGLLVGVVFGFVIAASGLSQYETIHNALLFQDLHMYFTMFSAIATAAPLLFFLRRRRWQTPTGEQVSIPRTPVQKNHVFGGLIFGSGWAIAGTCPAPVLAMTVGGGVLGVFVIGGLVAGTALRNLVAERSAFSTRRSTTAC